MKFNFLNRQKIITPQYLNDLINAYNLKSNLENILIFKKVFNEIKNIPNYNIPCNPIEDYQTLYQKIKRNQLELLKTYLQVLENYNFQYSNSLFCALRILLHTKQDNNNFTNHNPLSYPGLYAYKKNGNAFHLYTKLGEIKVIKANEYFKNTQGEKIFKRTLYRRCYERTWEFAQKFKESKVILQACPRIFTGQFHHAFIEFEGCILDLSCNCLYPDPKDAYKILSGYPIKTFSYEELQEYINNLKKTIPNIMDYNPLWQIGAYEDLYKKK